MKKLALSLVLVASVAFVSCKDTAKEGNVEETANEAIENVEGAATEAPDAIEETAAEATDAVEETATEATDAVEGAATETPAETPAN